MKRWKINYPGPLTSRTFNSTSSFAGERARSSCRRNNISGGIIYYDAREIWELALPTHEYVLLPQWNFTARRDTFSIAELEPVNNLLVVELHNDRISVVVVAMVEAGLPSAPLARVRSAHEKCKGTEEKGHRSIGWMREAGEKMVKWPSHWEIPSKGSTGRSQFLFM